MLRYEIEKKPYYIANISGGKDSMFMLDMILKNPEVFPLNAVMHLELEIDYPFIKPIIDNAEKALSTRGIKLYRIKPDLTWLEGFEKWGYPTGKARWCNKMYKLSGLLNMEKWLKSNNYEPIHYIGYCADEVKRFKDDKNIYPLALAGINEDIILEWAQEQPMYNNYYKICKRCGCMGCPLATRIEFAYLYKYYPEEYRAIIERMKESEKKYNCCVIDGHGKYNAEYLDNIIKTKWINILNERLCNNGQK